MLTEVSCARLASPSKVIDSAPSSLHQGPYEPKADRTGDAPILLAAQEQIRGEFRSKQALSPTDTTVTEGIQHATEVAKFLRENVVQGKKMQGEDSKYGTFDTG